MGDRHATSEGARVYVGGLNETVKKEDLEGEFEKFGKLNHVWVAFNPPGFAFVEFDSVTDAETACDNLNGADFLGSKLRVEIARGRSRRGGGGGFRGGSRGGRGGSSYGGGRSFEDRGFRGGSRGGGSRGGGRFDSYGGGSRRGGPSRGGGDRFRESRGFSRDDGGSYESRDRSGGRFDGPGRFRSRSPTHAGGPRY